MRRKSLADIECPIARALDLVGDSWTLLILRDALLGAARFQDFQAGLGMPPSTLTRRLALLTEQGLLVRRLYAEKPARECYELTEMGRDLAPVLLAFSSWGNRWLSPKGPVLECIDPESGQLLEPTVVDKRSLRQLRAGGVALRAGRGASRELRQRLPTYVMFGAPAVAEGSEP
jgi:DNA-binding HxlR family transcriptional regulator